MIYQTDSMMLNSVREVFSGTFNDVVVCQDMNARHAAYYTLLVIKDRDCAKTMLRVLDASERTASDESQPAMWCFSQNEELIYVFPYRRERSLAAFAEGQMVSFQMREATCVNLVMECLSSPLPYPLLYLVLEQNNLHIEKDNNVYFSYYFDLEQLDPDITEADCAQRCAYYILDLLDTAPRKKRLKSLELIRKKLDKGAYRGLPELYRDIKVTSLPDRKPGLKARLRRLWRDHRDGLFRLLLVLCVLAALLALIALVSQLIFGDIPFLRIFEKRFEVIGTESLTGK